MLGVHKKLWMDDVPASLPHREDELNKIYDFCTSFIENDDEENRSLYLGGVPGTGKTSCVLQVRVYSVLIKQMRLDYQIARGGGIRLQIHPAEWGSDAQAGGVIRSILQSCQRINCSYFCKVCLLKQH
jgi:hypothetical protein